MKKLLRIRLRVVLAIVTLGLTPLAAGALAAPAHAATLDYVALGDSYSAGTGAPGATGSCFRSPLGYPTLWANAHQARFTDVTCGGAVVKDVLAKQLSALSTGTDVVTMTIGGNDVGFAQTVAICLFGGDGACKKQIDDTLAKKAQYEATLDDLYTRIRAAAPNAKVYILGYPHLFEETKTCPASLNLTQRKLINVGDDVLNDSIKARAVAAGFTFVDVRAAFAGHAACASVPWLNGLTGPDVFLHPNAVGYREGYLKALTAVTG